jgi:hypothetical protein
LVAGQRLQRRFEADRRGAADTQGFARSGVQPDGTGIALLEQGQSQAFAKPANQLTTPPENCANTRKLLPPEALVNQPDGEPLTSLR